MSTIQLQTTTPTSNRTTGLAGRLLLTTVSGNVADTISLDVGPDREPGIDEVMVAVEAAPINGADLLFAAGWFAVYPQVPAAMGAEGAGTGRLGRIARRSGTHRAARDHPADLPLRHLGHSNGSAGAECHRGP